MSGALVFGEFDGSKNFWEEYAERLKYFLIANDISEAARKKAVLLTTIGPSTFSLLRSLVTPDGITSKSFDELSDKLKNHFSPKPSEVSQRFKFNSCVRKPGESVSTFVANLRALAEHCNFGESLEPMLRDRIVYGINDKSIQKRLLAESSVVLTFKRAVELALELEMADRDMRLLHTSGQNTERMSGFKQEVVHQLTESQKIVKRSRPIVNCFRCGDRGHIASSCRLPSTIIYNSCGKTGHIRKVCRSTQSRQVPRGRSKGKTSVESRAVHQVQLVQNPMPEDERESSDVDEHLYCLKAPSKSPLLLIEILIDDKKVTMEIDTGASVSVMSEKAFFELWPGRDLKPTTIQLCNYGNSPLPLCGLTSVKVSYQGQLQQLPLTVVKGTGPSLLGRDWLASLVMDWRQIHAIAAHDSSLQHLL